MSEIELTASQEDFLLEEGRERDFERKFNLNGELD